ncbi:hypothetical protein L1987_64711 [Smallanthus sonchifolius]|uniref:Uncharacterized protein n=1 Tax=Smallanthus sonchifolius TaxID=185202 RepID=A0ACB9BSM4_9ASTR|nr:hypothetical protein L1987_64711 [Smallanthus sonchifolius]
MGLMTEIVEMMEAEEREASVADQRESTPALPLMAIGEALSTSTKVDFNYFAVILCSKCSGLKEENARFQEKVEPLCIVALSYKENEKRFKESIESLKKERHNFLIKISEKQFHLDVAYKRLEKKNTEISKLQNEVMQLSGKIEKLKNSRFVVEHYESVVRQVNGLGLGTNAIPPPVSGKFVIGLIDIDLSCLDESSNQDNSSNKDDSSSKADPASDEFFSEEGSENTNSEGAVLEELIGEHKVVKNIVTNRDNFPDLDDLGKNFQKNMVKYYSKCNKSKSGQAQGPCYVRQRTIGTPKAESSASKSREPYRRVYKDKRTCFHCGTVGHIHVNCPDKNQGKRPVVHQQAVSPRTPLVKQPQNPKSNVVKPPVKPMVKPKIMFEAKPSVPRREKQRAKTSVSTYGSTQSGVVTNGCISFDNVNYCEQLTHNLLSVSQMCDKEYSVMLDKSECLILKPSFEVPEDWILMRAPRTNDTYHIDISVATTTSSVATCLLTKATEPDSILWHRKLGHISYHKMNHLVRNGFVTGVPKLRFSIVDDCTKDETAEILQYLIMSLESLCKLKVRRIRSDNGTEFKINMMELFCLKKGIHHEFGAPYTPQQNGVAEKKNRNLIETARTMMSDAKLPVTFWAEVVNTACLILKRVLVVKRHNKTCYELINNRPPNLDYLVPFGSPRTRSVEEWFEVDCSKHSTPPEPTGLAWGFDYDALLKSFNLPDLSAEDAAHLYEFFNGGDDSNFSTRATVQIVTPDSNDASASGTHANDDKEVIHVDGNDTPADPNNRVGNEALVDPINMESSSSS